MKPPSEILPSQNSRHAYSLVEVLVVLGIVGLLIGLTLPAIQSARATAARITCLNNFKQIGLGLQQYHASFGIFPPGPPLGTIDLRQVSPLSWRVAILPELGESPLASQVHQALSENPINPFSESHTQARSATVKLYLCPADGRYTTPVVDRDGLTGTFTGYIGTAGGRGNGGVLWVAKGVRVADILDGTSNTLVAGERPPPETLQAGSWYTWIHPRGYWGELYGPDEILHPQSSVVPGDTCFGRAEFGPGRPQNPCDRYHFWSFHRGGGLFLVADGSAKFLPYSAKSVLSDLTTRAGGEVVTVLE